MFCALITFLQYSKDIKPGVVLPPPTDVTGGGTTPLLKVLKVLQKLYLCTKHAYLF